MLQRNSGVFSVQAATSTPLIITDITPVVIRYAANLTNKANCRCFGFGTINRLYFHTFIHQIDEKNYAVGMKTRGRLTSESQGPSLSHELYFFNIQTDPQGRLKLNELKQKHRQVLPMNTAISSMGPYITYSTDSKITFKKVELPTKAKPQLSEVCSEEMKLSPQERMDVYPIQNSNFFIVRTEHSGFPCISSFKLYELKGSDILEIDTLLDHAQFRISGTSDGNRVLAHFEEYKPIITATGNIVIQNLARDEGYYIYDPELKQGFYSASASEKASITLR